MILPPKPENFLAPYQGERPPAPAWFDEALAQLPERTYFASSGVNIELLTWGRVGAPGLLFLHGNGAHADWWSHIAPYLAGEWRCAALSYSGMGRSDRRDGDYTVALLASEVIDAVAAAGLDRGPAPPILVGHSFGGAIGMAAACSEQPFGGLVMIDTPVNIDRERLKEMRAKAPRARSEPAVFNSLTEGLARFRLSPPQDCVNDFIGDHIARRSLVERDGKWYWHFDPRRVTATDDGHRDIASRVRCPIAYFYGEYSALVTPGELARNLLVFPHGTPVACIPGAAHHVLIDQPLALVSSLRTLLACWPSIQPAAAAPSAATAR